MERNTTLWERAAALVLALFMVFSMMPLQAFAEGAEEPTPGAVGTGEPAQDPAPGQSTAEFCVEINEGTAGKYTWDTDLGLTQSFSAKAKLDESEISAGVTYSWSLTPAHDGIKIREASGSVVTLDTAQRYLAGTVKLQVTAEYQDQVKTAEIDVTVTGKPQIQISAKDVQYGNPLTATVTENETDITKSCELIWTDGNGQSLSDTTKPGVGTYTVTARYPEDSYLNRKNATATTSVKVTKADETVSSRLSADSVVYGSVPTVQFTSAIPGTVEYNNQSYELTKPEGQENYQSAEIPCADKAAGTHTVVYTFEPSVSGQYNVTTDSGNEYTITPKPVSVASFTLKNNSEKTYDGTTAFEIEAIALNQADIVGDDDVSANIAAFTARANTAEAGSVTVTLEREGETLLTGSSCGNYSLDLGEVTVQGKINQKEITVSGASFSDKIYDGRTTVDSSYCQSITWSGVLEQDKQNVVLKYAAFTHGRMVPAEGGEVFVPDASVSANKVQMDLSNASLEGTAAQNYSLDKNQVPVSDIRITPKTVAPQVKDGFSLEKISDGSRSLTQENIAAIQNEENVYLIAGGAENQLIGDDQVVLDYSDAFDAAAYTSLDVFATDNPVTNIKVKLTGDDANNYQLPAGYTLSLNGNILPAPAEGVDLSGSASGRMAVAGDLYLQFRNRTNLTGEAEFWYTAGDADYISSITGYLSDNAETAWNSTELLDEAGKPYPKSCTEGVNVWEDVYVKASQGVEQVKYYGPFRITFRYDTTAPAVTGIDIRAGNRPAEPMQAIEPFTDGSIRIWDKSAVTVTVTAEDRAPAASPQGTETSGAYKTYLYASTEQKSIAELNGLADTAYQENSITIGKVEAERNSKFYLYVKLIDKAGNTDYRMINGAVLVDTEKPTMSDPNLAFTSEKSAAFTFTVSDGADATKAAGIKSVNVYLYDGVEDSLTQYGDPSTIFDVDVQDAPEELPSSDNAPLSITVNHEHPFKIEKYGSLLSILVQVEDWAGNTSLFDQRGQSYDSFEAFKEDRTAASDTPATFVIVGDPSVTVSYDNNTCNQYAGTAYFRENRTLTLNQFTQISVPELTVYYDGKESNLTGDYCVDRHAYVYQNVTHLFETDGVHSFQIDVPHGTVNTAEGTIAADRFVLDMNDPTITITYNDIPGGTHQRGVESVRYYHADRTIEIKVSDQNLPSLTDVNSKGNKYFAISSSMGEVHSWEEESPTVYKTTITFTKDTTASNALAEETDFSSFSVTVNDLTKYEDTSAETMDGHAVTRSDRFVLDKTNPVFHVQYDGDTNDIGNQYYFGLVHGVDQPTSILATVTLQESNFFETDATDAITVTKDGLPYTDYTITWTSYPGTDEQPAKVEGLITIPGKTNGANDGHFTVSYAYQDPAGNQMMASDPGKISVQDGRYTGTERDNIIDTVRPEAVFAITPTSNVYEEADYYNSNFTASFTVTDTNYDAGRITAKYAKGPVNDWSNDGTAMTRTDGVYTFTTAGEQKFYTFHIEGTDKANNKLSIVAGTGISNKDDFKTNANEGKFTSHPKALDTTAPIATIDFNATAPGDHYYEETTDGVTVKRAYYGITPGTIEPTVMVKDDNGVDYSRIYRGVNVSEAADMTSLGQGKTAPGSDAETLALVDAIGNDGDYTFSIYGTDKAGNALTVIEQKKTSDSDNNSDVQNNQNNGYGTLNNKYTTYPKTLDREAPTVEIDYTSLADTHYYEDTKSAYYKDDFAATYTFADDKGLDCTKLYTGVNVTDIAQYTQQGTDILELNNDNARQTVIPINKTEKENGSYTFSVYGEDKAGNPLTVVEKRTTNDSATTEEQTGYNKNTPYTSQYHKVLDTVAPVASFKVVPVTTPSHPEMQTLGNKNRFYLNTGFTATYSVTETNYDDNKVHAYYGHSNPEDYLNNSVSAGQEYIGSEKIRSYTSNGDGLYIFTLTGEDRAGNQVVAVGQSTALGSNPLESTENNTLTSYIITVDTVKPVLQAAIGDYYAAELKENAYSVGKNSPYRSEQSARLTLTATDPSPKVIQYATTSTRGDTSDGDVTALGSYNQGGSVLTLTRDFSGEQVFAMKALVVADLAGNVSTAPANVDGNVSNYIYLDVTPPTEDKLAPTVSLVAHESGQGRSVQGVDLYNSTVTVEAKISDPGFGQQPNGTGGTSSGLFTLHYVVQHNDSENWNGQMEGKVATTSANHGITTDADGIVYYTQSHQGIDYSSTDPVNEALVGEDTITFTFDAATFNYNDISIRVWAEDNTGHKSGEAIYRFGIDTTAPKIQVTYDNNDARNEKYFKADRTATVVVTERNFDPDNTVITTEVGHSGWSYAAGGLANGDDDTWTCTVPYTEDADYTFNVTAKDLVGHDAGEADYGDSVAPREFTVDKTKPVIEITFDNNDVRNGRYYKENRTATIHIEEHNFAAEDAEVTTTAEIAEGGVAAPAAGSWGSAGDSNTAQVPFNADGDYTMQVKFQDKAGNEAEPKEVELFTVDTTAPELTFSINDEAFEAGSYTPRAYNGQVVPGITYHDINYDGAGTQMSIVGAKNVNSQILSGAPAEDAMGGVYTCENIAETPENDDVYTCTGRVVDMAGNESTVDFLFSVNRYGSNYLLTPDTQALVDNYYTNSAPNLGVSEINVNTLKFEEITYALNGDIRTLQPGTDYQVTESGSETSWKQYDYTIFNSNFDREGVYDITIYSEDEAGNANSNHTERVKEYSKNISFVLDQTAPSITISGVDEGGIYDTDTRSVTVAYGENFAMDNLIITNGEKTETYTAEQLQATGGTLEFVVPASREKQSVKVTAADKAGNIATIESPRFVLSSSLFVRWVNNTPVMVGTISFGVLVVAAVADYLRKGFLFALLHKHTGVKH